MRKVNNNSFDCYVDNFQEQGKSFIVESKRNIQSLYVNNQIIVITKNRNNRFGNDKNKLKTIVNLFAQVQKGINKHLKQVSFEVPVIEKRFGSSKTNREKWRNMENGEVFYYIDIKHCFWRIAFLKGYISSKLYQNILVREELKLQRNMSLALIIAEKKRSYYKSGSLLWEIKEERTMYKTIYDNIRFTAYNLMGDCMELSKNHFLAYRTDGIMIDKKALKKVVKLIEDSGFNYVVKECCKIDMQHYYCDNEEKKF